MNQKGYCYTTQQSQWTGFPTYLHHWMLVLNAGQNLFMSAEIHCLHAGGTYRHSNIWDISPAHCKWFPHRSDWFFPSWFMIGHDSSVLCLQTKQDLANTDLSTRLTGNSLDSLKWKYLVAGPEKKPTWKWNKKTLQTLTLLTLERPS